MFKLKHSSAACYPLELFYRENPKPSKIYLLIFTCNVSIFGSKGLKFSLITKYFQAENLVHNSKTLDNISAYRAS